MSQNNTIRVLHLTSHNEECGIARYQEQFVDGMKSSTDIVNTFFGASPYQTRFMSKSQYDKVLEDFESKMKAADILHIQHELAFYKHRELESVIALAHRLHKKVIVTIHTALDVEYKKARFHGYTPHLWLEYARQLRAQRQFESIHLNPLKKANLIIVHNRPTEQGLINHGFEQSQIKIIRMPVPKLSFATKSQEIKDALHYKEGDVLFCTVGFVSRTKGVDQAIKALLYLPGNYKLAIIGGVHPRGSDGGYLDELTDYIAEHGLQDRVYITGYVEDDKWMNALIRECAMCVYPYDAHYYSYVSSAALSNSLANHRATIAYPTPSFKELNEGTEVIRFCSSPNYYELAKTIRTLDIDHYALLAKRYAEQYAYDKEAVKFADIYRGLLGSN